jgi:hypothetical protein
MRFQISFSTPMRILSTVLGMAPRHSAVDVGDDAVDIRMGWAFHASIPHAAIVEVRHADPVRFTRGVHGHNGRYVVNGAGHDLVAIRIDPPQPGVMVGFSVNLSEVTVSVDDPNGLVAALGRGSTT